MKNYREKIINIQTGQETYRDYTEAEIAEVEAELIELASRTAEAEAKATIRESALAKLAALGLTPDEVASL